MGDRGGRRPHISVACPAGCRLLEPARRKRGRSERASRHDNHFSKRRRARAADGVDVRLELPRRHGVSGYLSYTNSRVVQFGPVTGGSSSKTKSSRSPTHGVHARSRPTQRRLVRRLVQSREHGRVGVVHGALQSGTPLEVDEEELDELFLRPGSDMVILREAESATPNIRRARRRATASGRREGAQPARGNPESHRRAIAYNFGKPSAAEIRPRAYASNWTAGPVRRAHAAVMHPRGTNPRGSSS